MKYISIFKPNESLVDRIHKLNLAQDISSIGLHTTLCTMYADEKDEEKLITDLSRIKFTPFVTRTISYESFDNGAQVLTLSKPDKLENLHYSITDIFEKYSTNNNYFEEHKRKYYKSNYSPHITISYSKINPEITHKLKNIPMKLTEFYLLRKYDSEPWEEIAVFW